MNPTLKVLGSLLLCVQSTNYLYKAIIWHKLQNVFP